MKTSKTMHRRPSTDAAARKHRAGLASARRKADLAAKTASRAKDTLKTARKAFKKARKAAKETRKELKALKKASPKVLMTTVAPKKVVKVRKRAPARSATRAPGVLPTRPVQPADMPPPDGTVSPVPPAGPAGPAADADTRLTGRPGQA